ncbi:MAG: EAL domain-containing protein, partial [Ectothiorhodospiraceae bacterium]|nr:EAL domain-containing protein [Ectothiorhodospiraceae bacterium]
VRDTADAVEKMKALRRLGARFHIDDFGTGYSSLAYLKTLPVDGIKIDQSFVRDLASDPDDAAIIEAIVAVARRFHLALVAEGVETAEQQRYLHGQGCDYYQGFLLGRPVSAEEFTRTFLGAVGAPASLR